uniref:Uncharacterized protein n=1 Tax=Candidatus Kentrum sp. UNK TaxID=2126344 RepID=A0A451A0Y0_9GAMM|nr:MAG: hypothetical protein BECKUNK1418G_GA0071005_100827 [Candidatus Kentron sp. UNK]VFK68800.1 MAG: hypothetical protein BECKUNK1418H_GA0071006_100628 [Candidatus Kentron sp. UNK]
MCSKSHQNKKISPYGRNDRGVAVDTRVDKRKRIHRLSWWMHFRLSTTLCRRDIMFDAGEDARATLDNQRSFASNRQGMIGVGEMIFSKG